MLAQLTVPRVTLTQLAAPSQDGVDSGLVPNSHTCSFVLTTTSFY